MVDEAFFASWVAASDALPLVLVGSEVAMKERVESLKAHFSTADIFELVPHGQTIPIKDIRVLHATAAQRAWSGNRLIVIHQAEKLSDAAAQALLKILEEPTRTSRFVLTTRWYRRLLPTIRSRCIRVHVTGGRSTNVAPVPPLPASLLARFAAFAGDKPLSAEILEQIAQSLEEQLRQRGPTPALKLAYLRLRDYHRIAAEPSGNHKLARDVLLASLPEAR